MSCTRCECDNCRVERDQVSDFMAHAYEALTLMSEQASPTAADAGVGAAIFGAGKAVDRMRAIHERRTEMHSILSCARCGTTADHQDRQREGLLCFDSNGVPIP